LNYAIAKHQAYKNPTMLRDKACMLWIMITWE
jgi:hypothetical protein